MNLDLKKQNWKEFYLKLIFPKIQRGKRLKKADHSKGQTPYVSSTASNNGVDSFIGNMVAVRKFSNCLSLANSGSVGACFYQPFEFVASDHVTRLANPKFNKYVYLFLSGVVTRISSKYSFNREINDSRIKKEKILLPVNNKGEPDFEFMENYMRTIEAKQLKKYKQHISLNISKLEWGGVNNEVKSTWFEFELGKLFKLSQGKSKGLNHLKKSSSGINYLGATNLNNGVLSNVENVKKLIHKGNGIAFIRNGEGSMGYSIYKAENFIATSDISVGYNPNLNRHVGLFITTVADKVRGKYNFGYKRSGKRLKKEKLLLPANEKNEPDYMYMENYMKMLEVEKLKVYLNYKRLEIS